VSRPIKSRRKTRKHRANWRHFYLTDEGQFAHPGAPDSSGAPSSPHTTSVFLFSGMPHPASPAASHLTQDFFFLFDTVERVECVFEAIEKAPHYVGEYVLSETGHDLKGLYEGLVPMLALSLGVVAASTIGGAIGGAVAGALAGSPTGPGAIAVAAAGGAEGGAEGFAFGVAILEWMGIGFLAVYVGSNLGQSLNLSLAAVSIAWNAPDSPFEDAEVDRAARKLADAVALVLKLVLMAMVMFLLAKGTAAAASRVAELAGKLRASRFGAPLADWVVENWKSLVEDPRLRPKEPGSPAGGGGGPEEAAPKPAPVRKPLPAKKDAEPHNQNWEKIEAKGFEAQRPQGPVDMTKLEGEDLKNFMTLKGMGRASKAEQIMNSGTDFKATPLKEGDPLYAFGSSDHPQDPNTPYWLDQDGFNDVQGKFYKDGEWDRAGVKDYLALPCYNRADAIVQGQVTVPQTALESTIAPATENTSYIEGGEILQQTPSMAGGGSQITTADGTVKMVGQ
jgi:hypothetical protein